MGYLIFGLIFGAAVAAIAHSKGRTPVGWFFVGFFLGIIGLVLILVVSNLNQEKAYRDRYDDEARRLREQLRQERIKHETLREYTMRRLDVHDQVLGVDTKAVQSIENQNHLSGYLPAGNGAGAAEPTVQQPAEAPRSNLWYYAHNGETRGPVGPETIYAMLTRGQISGTTLLWAEHLPDWRPAALVPEFQQPAS